MSLCRLMVHDFMYGATVFDHDAYHSTNMYDRHDLENGKAYAEEYLLMGLQTEPFYGFPLREFAQWCKDKLGHRTHNTKEKAATRDK